jgi:hypothetical protein
MPSACFSLEQLQRQVWFALRDNAAVVYWSHRTAAVDFLTEEDQTLYTRELKKLRRGYRDNRILVIKAGLDLQINGVVFYPLLLDFNGLICPEYMMLRGSGLVDDMAYTPYLFTSKKARKEALLYLTKAKKEN